MNSFSYLQPSKFWMKLVTPFMRRIDLTIVEQLRYTNDFDVHIRFNSYGNPYVCNGLISYVLELKEFYNILTMLNDRGGTSIRLTLETMKYHLNGNLSLYQERKFVKCCKNLEMLFPNIKFYGGESNILKKVLYEFKKNINDSD